MSRTARPWRTDRAVPGAADGRPADAHPRISTLVLTTNACILGEVLFVVARGLGNSQMAGEKPAARLTDMHVCPMVTGIVPHVGGPILPPGAVTVLIGGLPAARVGDMATCVGPPDTIVL